MRLIIANIINPYDLEENEDLIKVEEDQRVPFFQMIGDSVMDGFKLVVTVAAMLLGFIALMELINVIFLRRIQYFIPNGYWLCFRADRFLNGYSVGRGCASGWYNGHETCYE